MRFDLIVNTMFKSAMCDRRITINNPCIWRPVLDVRDTSTAFLHVQAEPFVSGVFNVASGNYTVGEIGEIVEEKVESLTGNVVTLDVKDVQDFRNYKVTCAPREKNTLGFAPKHSISDIVDSLYGNVAQYGDFSRDEFYNIKMFQKQFAGVKTPQKQFASIPAPRKKRAPGPTGVRRQLFFPLSDN